MKSTRLLLSIVYLMLMSTIYAFAQQYPVQVITQLLPPYTLNVPAWYNGANEKLVVLLTNQDMNRLTQVRLRLRIEGSGVRITSRQGAFSPIINLDSGVPTRLSLNDLAPYFKPENLNFESGISYANYVKTYTLPEGFYFICFEAVEVFSGQVVGVQCGQAYLSLNDPPFLNMPRKGESILHRDPTNIIFQWTPRHMSDPYLAFNTEYEFTMVELLDNGMVPDAAFAINRPAFHQERSSTSTFLYGPSHPLLTPGRRYAWRICVKSNDGSNLSSFKNQGCSEVYWFTYQNDCLPPINIQAEAMTVAARITWTPVMASQNGTGLGGTYKVDYREYKMSPGDWQSTNSSTNRVTLDKLDPDRSYEYRVGRSCDDNLTYVYSDIKRFKTNVEVTRGDCGDTSELVPITNQEPMQTLHAGDVITGGGGSVRLRIVQVSGQGSFTGYGYMTFPLLGHAQIKAKFDNIMVNTDKQLIGGTFQSTYDKDEKQIADLDRKIEGGKTTAVLQTKADTTDYTIPFKISGPEAIEITSDASAENNVDGTSGAKLSIKNPDGSVKEIQVSKLPATIQDQDNTVYKIEQGKDGKAIVTKVGQQEQSKPNPTLANSTANSSIKATVQFKNYPEKQRYAFDEYQAAYGKSMLYKPKYEALANNYFVSHKAIVEGQTDVIKAVLTTDDKTMVADSVRFVSHQGFRYPSKIIAPNTFEVTIKGGTGGQTQELYATYPDGKKSLSLGKLLITSYNTQQRKVVLVPVNNASVDRGAISQKLNNIYNPIGIQFEVSQDASLDDMSWDTNGDGKLAVKGSGLFSTLTPEMKALNQVYSQSRSVQADAVYLFILPSADEVVAGDMPRGKQFGYLFSGDDGRVSAHEIGHGLFKLKHTFDGYGFAKGELSNNLMDYPAGDQLTKYQWDQVRDPGMVIGVFEKEKDGDLPVAQIVKCVSSAAIDVAFNYTFKWLELCWDDKPVPFNDYANILSQINKAELLSSAAIACGTSIIPWPTDKAKMVAAMTAAFGSGATAIVGDLYTQYETLASQNSKLGATDIIQKLNFAQALSKGGIQAAIAGVATGITIYSLDHPKFKHFSAKLQDKVSKQGTAFLTKAGLTDEAVEQFLGKFGVKNRLLISKLEGNLKSIHNDLVRSGYKPLDRGYEITYNNAEGALIAKISDDVLHVKIPHGGGWATQATTDDALAVLAQVKKKKAVYRVGTLDVSETLNAQYWSPENPLSFKNIKDYAEKYGVPVDRLKGKNKFIMIGEIQSNGVIISRPAVTYGGSKGGGMEIVTSPNSVKVESFHTIDIK